MLKVNTQLYHGLNANTALGLKVVIVPGHGLNVSTVSGHVLNGKETALSHLLHGNKPLHYGYSEDTDTNQVYTTKYKSNLPMHIYQNAGVKC